jgi:hydroxymethylglutaryl-CoA lyase
VNERGAERAIKTAQSADARISLLHLAGVSPPQSESNAGRIPARLRSIANLAQSAGLSVVAYVSMAFGNPYGDAWSIDQVKAACHLLIDAGIRQISLADTVGLATPAQISETVFQVVAAPGEAEIGVHLHARRQDAAAKIRAAYDAGCRRFDAAIGGLGGCPFAQDALVGNIPTEILVRELKELGACLQELQPLDDLVYANAEIAKDFGIATD